MKVHTASLCIQADNIAYQKVCQYPILHSPSALQTNKHLIQAVSMSSQFTAYHHKTRAHTSRKARTEHSPFIILAAKTSYIQRSVEAAYIRLPVWLLRAAIYTLYWRIAHRPPRLRTDFISRLADRSSVAESGTEASYENLWRRHVCEHWLRTSAENIGWKPGLMGRAADSDC